MGRFVVSVFSVLVLSTCIIPTFDIKNVVNAYASGAKSDFTFLTFDSFYSAYQALKAGTIDILNYPLPYELFMDAISDSNIKVVGGLSTLMYLFDLNNNYTIAEYPGVKSPFYEVKFRQAIAHAIDKDYIIEAFWDRMGERIDQPLPALLLSWMNESYLGDNYPYKYNLTRAAQLLNELGFVDTDGNGWRNYPPNWPGAPNADFTQYPIKVVIRIDHEQRRRSGDYLVQQLESIGIKCNTIQESVIGCYHIVFRAKNYHIYTGGWSIWKSFLLYALYHSMYWSPYTFSVNCVTGMNESNLANYPRLDRLLEEMYFASSFEIAMQKLKAALGFMVENCINIPLLTPIEYYAHRSEVQGIVYINASHHFLDKSNVLLNKYSLLSAFKNDRSPIVVGILHHYLHELNVVFSHWLHDLQTLAMFYDPLIYYSINDPLNYLPWLASWNIGTWYDVESGQNKTKITFHMTNNSYWIKPVTGEVIGRMTAYDFDFTTWYYYQTLGNYYPFELHHIRILDDYTVEVYMNTTSVWNLLSLNYPIIPKQVWTDFGQLAWRETKNYVEGVNVTTPGYIDLAYQGMGAPVTVECIIVDGYPLIKYEDYNIEMGKIKIYKDLSDGTRLNVTYYALGDPYGTFPGNLPWQDILVGNGPFYITEIVGDPFNTDGYIYFKANPYYNIRLFNRDLAIRNIAVSKTMASVGENITVFVEVENEGEISENFELTLYANESIIGRRNVYLQPNSSSFITFQWNTYTYNPGEYVVWAKVPILHGENDTSDNIYVDGIVTLRIPIIDVAVTQITTSKNVVNYGETLPINVTVENQGEAAVSFTIKLYGNTSIIDQAYVANLPSQSSIILPFTWNTNGWTLGCYILTAQADILEWETDIEDNFLTDGIVTILLPSIETFLIISPSITKVTLGNSFTVSVSIFNVVDLYGYDIIIRYNTSLLTANSVQEGPFLRSAGATIILANIINDEEGVVRFAAVLLGAPRGVNGNGTLFTIEFTASSQYTGTSTLLFDHIDLANHTIQPITCLAINGQVTIVEIDVKICTVVKNEITYKIIAVSNSTIHMLSYVEEDYRIELEVSGASGTNGFCNITIPKGLLTGFLVVLIDGNPVAYTKIENETHITLMFTFHNSQSKIQIIETVFGDLNGDRIVNIFDVVIVCIAYGSQPGSPNWNPVADIIRNNRIDIFDAVAVCVNYGNRWQPP